MYKKVLIFLIPIFLVGFVILYFFKIEKEKVESALSENNVNKERLISVNINTKLGYKNSLKLVPSNGDFILRDISITEDEIWRKSGLLMIYHFYGRENDTNRKKFITVATDYNGNNPEIFTEGGADIKYDAVLEKMASNQVPISVINYGIEGVVEALHKNEDYKKYIKLNPCYAKNFEINLNNSEVYGWEWKVSLNCYDNPDLESLNFSVNPEKDEAFLVPAKNKKNITEGEIKDLGISNEFYYIEYPSDWLILSSVKNKIADSEGGVFRSEKISPSSDKKIPLVEIIGIKSSLNLMSASIEEMVSEDKEDYAKDSRIYDEKDFTYNLFEGGEGNGRQFKVDSDSDRMLVILIFKGENLIKFSYKNNANKFDDDFKIIKKMLGSWKIK